MGYKYDNLLDFENSKSRLVQVYSSIKMLVWVKLK